MRILTFKIWRMWIEAFVLSVGKYCDGLGQLNDCNDKISVHTLILMCSYWCVQYNTSLSKNYVTHAITVVCVIGWIWEKKVVVCAPWLSVHLKSVVEQVFVYEFAFENKCLKHLSNFEFVENVRSSNVVEFEFKLCHMHHLNAFSARFFVCFVVSFNLMISVVFFCITINVYVYRYLLSSCCRWVVGQIPCDCNVCRVCLCVCEAWCVTRAWYTVSSSVTCFQYCVNYSAHPSVNRNDNILSAFSTFNCIYVMSALCEV